MLTLVPGDILGYSTPVGYGAIGHFENDDAPPFALLLCKPLSHNSC